MLRHKLKTGRISQAEYDHVTQFNSHYDDYDESEDPAFKLDEDDDEWCLVDGER